MGLSAQQVDTGWKNDHIGTRLVHETDALTNVGETDLVFVTVEFNSTEGEHA